MELILKKDVENLGFADDIVTVKNGYGRNYLIPQGYGVLATASAKKVLAENLKQRAFKEKRVIEDAQKVAAALKEIEVKLTAKTAAGDKLFGSINNANVVDALEKQGHSIDRRFVSVIGGNIKRTGKYNAVIRLHREVIVDFPFEVVAEAK